MLLASLFTISACNRDKSDADGDGFSQADDCDDDNDAVFPGAEESCNGIDDDCDDEVDEAGATGEQTFYADQDGDGYGDAAAQVLACELPADAAIDSSDCDDTDAGTHPGAEDIPCTGVAEDCMGTDGDLFVPDDHASIQDAVDAADEGDRICVAAGTWGPFIIEQSVSVASLEGADSTVIDGGGVSPLAVVDSASDVLIRGFTFQNGVSQGWAAGVTVGGASSVTISDNVFDELDGEGETGGLSVLVSEGTVIRGNLFRGCKGGNGGGVTLTETADALLVDNVFEDNEAMYYGAGLAILGAESVVIEGGSFSGGLADYGGGALMGAEAVSLEIVDVEFDGNISSGAGGHVWLSELGTLEIALSQFSHGVAADLGGGLLLGDIDTVTFEEVSLFENTSSDHGGAVWATTIGTMEWTECSVESNTGALSAGLYTENVGELSLVDTDWTNNVSPNVGAVYVTGAGDLQVQGGVWTENQAHSGGGLYHRGDGTNQVQVDGAVFSGNISTGSYAALVIMDVDEIRLDDVEISENVGAGGSGALLAEAISVELDGCSFARNTSYGDESTDGAGLVAYNLDDLIIRDTSFVDNQAGPGGWGGGFMIAQINNVTLLNSVLQGNSAWAGGGGGVDAVGNLVVSGGEVSGNSADSLGGGFHISNSTTSISGTDIHDNTPDNVYCEGSAGCTPL
jgi:hypothetical protein